MQNQVISEKKSHIWSVVYEETVCVLVDFFVNILTRKHGKDLLSH